MAGAAELEPSVPRTPTQFVLRIVSVIMALVGALVLLGGIVVIVTDDSVGVVGGDPWAILAFGIIIVVTAGLLLLTATLGIVASNDSARVGPYRFLCYLVGLAVLVAIVWGWGLGTFILFNPIILTTTIVYVLICSTLADKVKDEHDRGIVGETFLRSRHQRALHLLCEVIVLNGVLTVVVITVAAVCAAVYGEGGQVSVLGTTVTVGSDLLALLVEGAIAAVVDLLVGCLGIYGSNRPARVRPFLVLSEVALAIDLARVGYAAILHGVSGLSFDVMLDTLFTGTCLYLAMCILHQLDVTPAAMTAPDGGEVTAEA